MNFLHLMAWAEIVDAWRVFPRLFLVGYGVACFQVLWWFLALPMPTLQHTAFASLVTAMFVPIAKFYMDGGRVWGAQK